MDEPNNFGRLLALILLVLLIMKKLSVHVGLVIALMGLNVSVKAQGQPGNPVTETQNQTSLNLQHSVKKGETYYSIAKLYKTTVADLQALNPDMPVLKAGATIKVKRPVVLNADAANSDPVKSTSTGNTGSNVGVTSSTTSTTANIQAKAGSNAGSSSAAGTGKAGSTAGGGNANAVTNSSTNGGNGLGSASVVSPGNTATSSKQTPAAVERTGYLVASDINKAGVIHVVQQGETLYKISQMYRIPVDRICYINEISENTPLQVGRTLVLPPEARNATTKQDNLGTSPADSAYGNQVPINDASAVSNNTVAAPVETAPNNAIAPNPISMDKGKNSANTVATASTAASAAGKSGSTAALTSAIGDGNKRDAGGMPEQATKKKVSLKEYSKVVNVTVGQAGWDPERFWVQIPNMRNGEVVALMHPENHTVVHCVVQANSGNKNADEIFISEAIAKKLGIEKKKAKLELIYAAP